VANDTSVREVRTGDRPRRAKFLIPAVVLVVAAVVAVIVAASSDPSTLTKAPDTSNLPVGPAVPALDARGWINSPPLTPAALTGKVVVYDFWTYSCINCVRTFPYVRALYDRYQPDGLVVIGVHSPEFDFEKVHANVAAAVKRDDVTWPVALDDNMKIWNAFGNQYWPADYVADRNGHERYSHFGEGDYSTIENVVRALLGVPPTSPRADVRHPEATSAPDVNPETYLGTEMENGGAVAGGQHTYPSPGTVTAPNVALGGSWNGGAENITSTAPGANIVLGVHAREVNLVLSAQNGQPADLIVQVNGKPVPPAQRGAAIKVNAAGQTYAHVTAADMYRLILAPQVVDETLTLTAPTPGLEAYDFTFG
jgi:thiol-disulfide isomerase/thioredoxin